MKAWLARDKDKGLYLYLNKPKKGDKFWITTNIHEMMALKQQDLPEGVNPQWSDDEPIEVELKLKMVKQ